MRQLILSGFLLLFFQITVTGQTDIQNGEYYYHAENISSNFFDQPTYAIDSILFFYFKTGDTLTYYTGGGNTACTTKEFKKIEKKDGFGKYIQKGLTLTDGRILVHYLSKNTFLIRNDSLFQWSETYSLSEDSIKQLKSIYDLSKTLKERERISEIIDKNTKHGFVFIFSPSLFNNGTQQLIADNRSNCPNLVTLISKWSTQTTDYYRIEISNDCGIWGHRWGYVISKDFKFVSFGGYSSKESKYLSKENLVITNE